MSKFKKGDVIIIEECFAECEEQCKNKIVEIISDVSDYKIYFNYISNKHKDLITRCFLYSYHRDKFRHATDREKFLYLMHGENVLKKGKE